MVFGSSTTVAGVGAGAGVGAAGAGREMLQFMCVPEVLGSGASSSSGQLGDAGGGERSFEELRITTYLHAYQTTGQLPPAPMSIAPSFQPTMAPADPSGAGASSSSSGDIPGLGLTTTTPAANPPADPTRLPQWHEFTQTRVSASSSGTDIEDRLQSISAQAQEGYSAFSPEELRYHAYLAGRIHPPQGAVKMDSTNYASTSTSSTSSSSTSTLFGLGSSVSNTSSSSSSPSTSTLFGNTATGAGSSIFGGGPGGGAGGTASGAAAYTTETLLSLSSKPEFAGCSFEELRLASLALRPTPYARDVTSNEILGISSAGAGSAGGGGGGIFGSTGTGGGGGLFGSTGSGSGPGGGSMFGSTTGTLGTGGGGIFGSAAPTTGSSSGTGGIFGSNSAGGGGSASAPFSFSAQPPNPNPIRF